MTNNKGLIFMPFGRNSAASALESLTSARIRGIDLPAVSIGSNCVKGTTHIPWKGVSPWASRNHPKRHRFFAGNVKPFLYKYTPFEFNLYLDADTEIWGDIMPGFEYLLEYDVCITEEFGWTIGSILTPDDIKPQWDKYRKERDHTIKVLGSSDEPYINSGVIFFRKNERAANLFEKWHQEWLKYTTWQEEMALMRAVHLTPDTKVLWLGPEWNKHKPDDNTIVYHMWGKARDLIDQPRTNFPAPRPINDR
jgi:hypothetical protein